MKRISTLFVLAVTALTMTAAAGAATASADTVLCDNWGYGPCASEDILPAGSTLVTGSIEGTPLVLKRASGTAQLSCGSSFMLFTTTAASGSPLSASTTTQVNPSLCAPFGKVWGAKCSDISFNERTAGLYGFLSNKGAVLVEDGLTITMDCSAETVQYTCEYSASSLKLNVNHDANTAIAQDVPVNFVKGSSTGGKAAVDTFCGTTGTAFTLSISHIFDGNAFISHT